MKKKIVHHHYFVSNQNGDDYYSFSFLSKTLTMMIVALALLLLPTLTVEALPDENRTRSTTTNTWTLSGTSSHTFTRSGTKTQTHTGTQSTSLTRSPSLTRTFSATSTRTSTFTPTGTISETVTTSGTISTSLSKTLTRSKSFSETGSSSQSLTRSESVSSTASESRTFSRSQTYSGTQTVSYSLTVVSPTPTFSLTKSITASLTHSSTKTGTFTSTGTGTKSHTLSRSQSLTFTRSLTGTKSSTATGTISKTISGSKSLTKSLSLQSLTHTFTHSATLSSTHTATDTRTVSGTLTPTLSSSLTISKSLSLTFTKSSTFSKSLSQTFSRTLSGSDSLSTTRSLSESESHSLSSSLSPSFTESLSSSSSHSISTSETLSMTFSTSTTFSLSESASASKSRSFSLSESGTPDPTLSFTISKSHFTASESVSHPLTTSAMPPTTTPVPTRTFTFMTRCPSNCMQGECNNAYPYQCICYKSLLRGYWGGSELGGPCDDCASGFFGPRCTQPCAGGSCSSCGGHGVCDEGRSGTGECLCFNSTQLGFWDKTASGSCSRCQADHYGINCQFKCSCLNGGTCFDGRPGNGTCKCPDGYSGPNCQTCDPNTIPNCKTALTCPNDCSGNGVCNPPPASSSSLDGECACYSNYAGNDCSITCKGMLYPTATTNTSCNGRSSCNDGRLGDGSCAQPCSGNFDGDDCASCKKGYWGASCNQICPGGVAAPCNNSGTCQQATGACQCFGGFGGSNCDVPCPKGSNGLSCSGNGLCDSSAACVCYQDSTLGYWNGTTCDVCNDDYRGSQCTIKCPTLGGRVCNDTGVCNSEGKCDCTLPACGRVCDTILNGTRCNSCPVDGFYGPGCSTPCLCEHGNCSQGINGDGSCECEFGWAGEYCNITCPLGPGPTTCSGNGGCIQTTAQCDCKKGYAGPSCSLSCPDLNCSGNGLCNDTSSGDGTCDCFPGFVGAACDTKCNNCGPHGTCTPGNSTCICEGNFTGPNCDTCLDGLSGSNCDVPCVNGFTNGTTCQCYDDWTLPDCSAKCPVDPVSNLTCGGPSKGTCNPNTAKCICASALLKGPSCSCSIADCQSTYNTLHVTCDETTGQCLCSENRAGLSSKCDKCKFGYWASDCSQTCDCNDHGSCDKTTGACSCFSNTTHGFWTGVQCQQCQTGYMGANCQQRAVSITTVTPINYQFPIPLENQYTLRDESRGLYYVGAAALNLIFNVTPTIPTVISAVFEQTSPTTVKVKNVDHFVQQACRNTTRGGDGGAVAGLHYYTTTATSSSASSSPQLLYLFQQNTTCPNIPIRGYLGPSSQLNFFINNRTRVINEILPAGLVDFSFYFPRLKSTCILTVNQELACQHVVDPNEVASYDPATTALPNIAIEIFSFNFLRFAAKSPESSQMNRIVLAGSDSASRCLLNYITLSLGGGSSVPPSSFTVPTTPLTLTNRRQPHDINSEVRFVSGNTWTCRSVDSFYETPSGFLVYAVQADRGCYIGGFTTTNDGYRLKSGGVNPSSPNDIIVFAGAQVTSVPYTGRAIVYDDESGIGIAIFNSLAIKFRLSMNATIGQTTVISPYGQRDLGITNIYKMDLFLSQQIAYAPRKLVRGVQVLRFLMIEVLSINPTVADRRGGAVVTVSGTGFRNVPTAVCSFGIASNQVPATYISPTQISCVAPFSDSTDTCLLQPVEVSMNGNMFTQNNVLIDRPNDVTIVRADPPRVKVGIINKKVRLIGRGFVDNVAAKCKLVLRPDFATTDFRIYNAIYVSPTTYDCIVPLADTISHPGSYMTLALDGQKFSSTSAPHSVLGTADNVLCTPDVLSGGTTTATSSSNSSSSSSAGVAFPPWPSVFIRDQNNNLLFDFDDTLTRSVTIRPSDGFNITFPSSTVPVYPYVLTNGTAKLSGYRVPDPTVGIRPTIISVDNDLFTCTFNTEITPGDLAKLKVRTQPVSPGELLPPVGLLPQTTEVVLLDIGGNPISAAGQNYFLNVTFVMFDPDNNNRVNLTYRPQTPIAVRDNGVAPLAPFLVELVFGTEYAIYFVVSHDASISAMTDRFSPSCPNSTYQVIGEDYCRPCPPDEAKCDGTPIILNRPGYWRLNNRTVTFLECRNYEACPGGTPLSFGSSACGHGYQGVMCDDCVDGYGKTSKGTCEQCPAFGSQLVLFFVVLFFMLALFFCVIVMALQNSAVPTSSLGRAAVLLTLFITNFQNLSLLSFLGINWGAGMTVVLNISAFLFEFRIFSLHAVNCLFRKLTGMNDAYIWIMFLIFTLFLIPMIFIVKFVLKCKPDLFLSIEAKKKRDEFNKIAKKSYLEFYYEGYVKEHQVKIIALVCIQVFLFFLTQIDFYYLLAILKCIVVGEDLETGKQLRVMSIDVRVDCDSSVYQSVRGLSIAVASILGFIVTFVTMVYMGYYRYRRYEDDFEAAWSFMFLGIKIDSWPWNPMILIRKLLLVLIVSFLDYPIALYLYLWIFMVWSWLEFDVRPYIDGDFNQLAMVFNIVLILVTNAGMTLEVIHGELTKQLIDAFCVLIIIASLILFFWKCMRLFVTRYMQERREAATEYVEDVDESVIEAELQKRFEREVVDDKIRNDEEMKSIERLRKELRVKAIAERKRLASGEEGSAGGKERREDDDDNDGEFHAVARDHKRNRKEMREAGENRDTFSTILDDFYGAAEEEEKEKKRRQSRGAEDVASWGVTTSASAFDDDDKMFSPSSSQVYKHVDSLKRVGDNNKRNGGGGGIMNDTSTVHSDTASAVSASSALSSSARRKRKAHQDNDAAITSYDPLEARNKMKNSPFQAQPRNEVDNAIDDFFGGGGGASDFGQNDIDNNELFASSSSSPASPFSSPNGGRSSNNFDLDLSLSPILQQQQRLLARQQHRRFDDESNDGDDYNNTGFTTNDEGFTTDEPSNRLQQQTGRGLSASKSSAKKDKNTTTSKKDKKKKSGNSNNEFDDHNDDHQHQQFAPPPPLPPPPPPLPVSLPQNQQPQQKPRAASASSSPLRSSRSSPLQNQNQNQHQRSSSSSGATPTQPLSTPSIFQHGDRSLPVTLQQVQQEKSNKQKNPFLPPSASPSSPSSAKQERKFIPPPPIPVPLPNTTNSNIQNRTSSASASPTANPFSSAHQVSGGTDTLTPTKKQKRKKKVVDDDL